MKNIKIPEDVNEILNVLNNSGYESYIVGGCVRDSLLNKQPKDWDITTNALPSEVKLLFNKTIDTGIKHGTITVVVNGTGYEITTYRLDGEYSDNRRPDNVIFTSSLKEDLSRRDFTINSMAYNNKDGIIDYFGGQSDLLNKTIVCVGNSDERFNEDALRILRAVRFSSQLGFKIQDATHLSMIAHKELLRNISAERIASELCKILCGGGVKSALEHNIPILNIIIPEISICDGFDQCNIHHDKDVLRHTFEVIENVKLSEVLRLSALFHDIGKPICFSQGEDGQGHFISHHKISADMSREILKRLKFDNKTVDKVSLLVYNHMSRYDKLRTSNIKKFINRVGIDNLDELFELQIADIKGCAKEYRDFSNVTKLKEECHRIISEKQPLTIKDLEINGWDLMSIGIPEGKLIGNTLKILINMVIDGKIDNNKELLMNKAKELKAN